jgi:glycosyltransferase involved in cell wall biosynthesis
MTTSIMMCTYNRLEFTKRMLTSFWETTKGPYRLIIVDNGSTDGTKEWLEEMAKNNSAEIHLHFNKENKGIAIGRNQGLLLANRFGPDDEFLATVDNDVELPDNWLQQCTDIISDNHRIAIGANFEAEDYPIVTRGDKTFQLKKLGNLGTASSVFHRELHKKIGYFTTDYGIYGEEDADFYFRARLVGWEMGYLKDKGQHFDEVVVANEGYREFKTQAHKNNLVKFQNNCYAYTYRIKPVFIPYHGPSM